MSLNIEMTLVELIHYVSKCKWLLSIKLLSAACRSMLFARLNGDRLEVLREVG